MTLAPCQALGDGVCKTEWTSLRHLGDSLPGDAKAQEREIQCISSCLEIIQDQTTLGARPVFRYTDLEAHLMIFMLFPTTLAAIPLRHLTKPPVI